MRRYAGLCGFLDVVVTGLVIGLAVFDAGLVGFQSEVRADSFGSCDAPWVRCPATCPYGTTGTTCTVTAGTPVYGSGCPGCSGWCDQTNTMRPCPGTRPQLADPSVILPCVCNVTGCVS